jgi:cytidine deaminase
MENRMSKVDWPALRAAAVEVMHRAYAPYSKFPVGAAGLVDDGRVVLGCNVENAAYGVVLCAECGMVSQLHATGGGRLIAMACVDGDGEPLLPCGRCRQLLWENGGPAMLVDSKVGPLTMDYLLPLGFGRDDLAGIESPWSEQALHEAEPDDEPATDAPRGRKQGGRSASAAKGGAAAGSAAKGGAAAGSAAKGGAAAGSAAKSGAGKGVGVAGEEAAARRGGAGAGKARGKGAGR